MGLGELSPSRETDRPELPVDQVAVTGLEGGGGSQTDWSEMVVAANSSTLSLSTERNLRKYPYSPRPLNMRILFGNSLSRRRTQRMR